MKRILSIVLVLCMALGVLSVSASALDREVKIGPLTFWLSEDTHTATLSSCERSAEGTVMVPSEVEGCPVTEISGFAFSNCAISKVILPDGIKKIEEHTFENCSALKEVVFPSDLEEIGQAAFYYTGLTQLHFPSTLRVIGKNAFASCLGFTSVTFPDGLQRIDDFAFHSNYLAEVVIPGSVEYLGSAAFSSGNNLRHVVIEDGVREINGSFSSCMHLQSVTLPESLERIAGGTFSSCPELRDLALPHSLKYLGAVCVVPAQLRPEDVSTEGGVTYALTYAIQADPELTELKLRENTTVIMDELCHNVGAVDRPLQKADLRSQVTYIGKQTFAKCRSLETVIFPEGLLEIGEKAFSECSALQNASLNDGLQKVGVEAFSAAGITELKIPASVTELGQGAFQYCRNLTSLTIPGTLRVVPVRAFFENLNLKSLVIEEGVEDIQTEAFSFANSLERASLPLSLRHLGMNSFYPAGKLKDVTYPGTLHQWAGVNDEHSGIYIQWPSEQNTFIDVPTDQYYFKPVDWALDRGITTGTSPTTFSPDQPCTRAQIVTFLWRLHGSPRHIGYEVFDDVSPDDYFYDAVKWAVQHNITNGTGKSTFSPNETVTRAQAVTFIWRMAGRKIAEVPNPFVDVPSDTYYSAAVLWCVDQNITNGTSMTTFSPEDPCTRAQIVTFLYRIPSNAYGA